MKRFLSLLVAGLMFGASVTPAWADDVAELKAMVQQMKGDYEKRIAQLESKIEQLQAKQQKDLAMVKKDVSENTMNIEYVGRQKGGVMIDGPGDSNVRVGGYIDMEFENFENDDAAFDQHRLVLAISTDFTDRIRFDSEFEIEHGGTDAATGEDDVQDGSLKVEYAAIDYLIEDWVNVSFGAILTPFGRYNLYHDSDMNDLTDRPLMARDVIPTTWTEAGVGLFGDFNPTFGDYEDMEISYQTYVINGLDNEISDTGLRSARGSLKDDDNNNKALVGRVAVSPFLNHTLGVSGYTGAYNDNGDEINGTALDWFSKFGPFEAIAEYAYWDVDDNDGVDAADTIEGGYAQLNYHFWPEFLDDTFLGRNFDNPTFTLVGRYGWAEIDDDSDAGVGDNEEDRYTLGFNYRPVENFVWKLEYQWNDTENELLERGSNDGFMTSFALGF